MNKNERHAKLSELPPGARRLCVQLAITMTWLSACAFLAFVCCMAVIAQPSDTQVLVALVLFSLPTGIAHGLHSRLKLQITDSREFVSDPGRFDYTMLALSVLLLSVACCVGAASFL